MEDIVDGSMEWLLWRHRGLGASDAPIVLGESPYKTPYQLWSEKIQPKPPEQITNYAIDMGNRLEPRARARFELQNNITMTPIAVEHPEYEFLRASLDGYNKEANIALEIKVPGAEVFDMAKAGKVHPKYYAQVQQQMMCSGAKENHFYCVRIEGKNEHTKIVEDATVIVKPDYYYQDDLIQKMSKFWNMVQEKIAPPLMDRDVVEIKEESLITLFAEVKDLKKSGNDKKMKALVEKITKIMPHVKCKASGVMISRVTKKTGDVDFSRMPEFSGFTETQLTKYINSFREDKHHYRTTLTD